MRMVTSGHFGKSFDKVVLKYMIFGNNVYIYMVITFKTRHAR